MPPNDYDDLKDVILYNNANPTNLNGIQIQFSKDPAGVIRTSLPYAIGKSTPDTSEIEMILCYQYDDGLKPTHVIIPHPKRANFRCFKVSDINLVNVIPFVASDPTTWKPKGFTHKQVQKQNCVELVDKYF